MPKKKNTKKLHICYVTRNYDAPHMGGRNPSLRYIAEELRKRGHKVTIISTPFYNNTPDKRWPSGIHFTKFSFTYYFNLLLATRRIYRLMKKVHSKKHIDIVHSCEREFAGLSARNFKKKYNIPFIQWMYDQGYPTQKKDILQNKKNPIKYLVIIYMKLAEKAVLDACDRITTIGPDLNKVLVRRGWPSRKIVFIGNTVDTNKFRPGIDTAKTVNALGLKGKKVITHIARVNRIRGTDIFVKSANLINKKIKNCVFLVVGNDKDDFKGVCVKLQKKYGLDNLKWTGRRNDVPEILNASVCHMIPVRKIAGGIGNTLLESMACGTPAVQSKVAGAPYAINNWKNSILFSDGDYKTAAEAIIKLCNNPALAKKIGKNARKTVIENYNVPSTTDRLLNLYESLIESPKSPVSRK